ncbi:MAG: transposase [Oscillospiraceae bacterium]|nr:transposase [Oscillospiraceae bacterium]
MTDLPIRRHPRLKSYDYSQNGAYFVTFCTAGKEKILSKIRVGRDALIPPRVELTEIGAVVAQAIGKTKAAYPTVQLASSVIMPNHVHLLLTFDHPDGGMRASRPTLAMVVRAIKTSVTRQIGHSIWQDSFYEHVIRNEEDFLNTMAYIQNNPAKWILQKKENSDFERRERYDTIQNA